MRGSRLTLLAFLSAFILIIAACNGDGDDTDDVDVPDADDVTEEVTVDETPDEAATDETPEDATTDETPEATVEDDTTPTDDNGMMEQETAQLTVSDDGIEITLANGMGTDATPEADETPENGTDETPEAGDDATPDANGDATPGTDDDEVTTFSSGNILFQVMNDTENEIELAIEQDETSMNGATSDMTPEADGTPEGDETPDANGEETPEANGTTGMPVAEIDEPVGAGEQAEWEVQLEPGDYVIYVLIDGEREEGMEARISVQESGTTDSDAMTPEADATPDDEETPEDDEEETPEADGTPSS